MQGREIIHGRFLHPEERKAQASPGLHRIPLKHLEILAGIEEKVPKTNPEGPNPLDAEDEAWLAHMLSLAEDAPEELEKKSKEEDPEYKTDEALIDDFIHNKGAFAQ